MDAEPAQQPGGRVGDILAQAAMQGFPVAVRSTRVSPRISASSCHRFICVLHWRQESPRLAVRCTRTVRDAACNGLAGMTADQACGRSFGAVFSALATNVHRVG